MLCWGQTLSCCKDLTFDLCLLDPEWFNNEACDRSVRGHWEFSYNTHIDPNLLMGKWDRCAPVSTWTGSSPATGTVVCLRDGLWPRRSWICWSAFYPSSHLAGGIGWCWIHFRNQRMWFFLWCCRSPNETGPFAVNKLVHRPCLPVAGKQCARGPEMSSRQVWGTWRLSRIFITHNMRAAAL